MIGFPSKYSCIFCDDAFSLYGTLAMAIVGVGLDLIENQTDSMYNSCTVDDVTPRELIDKCERACRLMYTYL